MFFSLQQIEEDSEEMRLSQSILDVDGYTQRFEDWHKDDFKSPDQCSKNKPKKVAVVKQKGPIKHNRKSNSAPNRTSYIINREIRRGQRLIQIKIYDLMEGDESDSLDSESEIISAQYVVMDPIDEILDSTENLINRISKQICNR